MEHRGIPIALDPGPPPARPTRVLVVDDEPDISSLIRQTFRRQIAKKQYEFYFASNGREALEELQRRPEIDLVLSDINMPEMDGLTLLQRISVVNPLVRVVMVSAYGDMQNIRQAMNHGAFDFVTKPIDFVDLQTTLEKTAQHARALRRSVESVKDNPLLSVLASSGTLERLLPAMRSAAVMMCDVAITAVAMIEVRGLVRDGLEAPTALVSRLNQIFDVLLPGVTALGGTLERFFSSGALVSFRGEHPAQQALSACVEGRALLAQHLGMRNAGLPPAINLAIAVDVGDVICSIVGAPGQQRMDYTVLGAPVSRVLSLAALAAPGQILLTDAVAKEAASGFRFAPIGSKELPGEHCQFSLGDVLVLLPA